TPHRLLATSHTFPSFFFNASSTTDIYPLSLHDALPIYDVGIGDVRPALGALLLGGRDRRVLARVADLHRGRHRHPSRHALRGARSEEHTSELQSLAYLVCRLLLEKKKRLIRTPRMSRSM